MKRLEMGQKTVEKNKISRIGFGLNSNIKIYGRRGDPEARLRVRRNFDILQKYCFLIFKEFERGCVLQGTFPGQASPCYLY